MLFLLSYSKKHIHIFYMCVCVYIYIYIYTHSIKRILVIHRFHCLTSQSTEGSLIKISIMRRRRSLFDRRALRAQVIVPSKIPLVWWGRKTFKICLVSRKGISSGTGKNLWKKKKVKFFKKKKKKLKQKKKEKIFQIFSTKFIYFCLCECNVFLYYKRW